MNLLWGLQCELRVQRGLQVVGYNNYLKILHDPVTLSHINYLFVVFYTNCLNKRILKLLFFGGKKKTFMSAPEAVLKCFWNAQRRDDMDGYSV